MLRDRRSQVLDFRATGTYHVVAVAPIPEPKVDVSLTRHQRESVRRLAEAHGGSNVRVFGSRARREAAPSSDIDLLVDMSPGSSLLDLIAIKHDVEGELGFEVDVVTESSLSRHLREQVLHEAVPV